MPDAIIRVAAPEIGVTVQEITVDVGGARGASDYELWLAAGNSGTITEFINRARTADLLLTLGQSLAGYHDHKQTTVAPEGMLQFIGGDHIERFPDFIDPTANRDYVQNPANYASLVPWTPSTIDKEITHAGIALRRLEQEDVAACLPFAAGYSGQSARLLRQGGNLFKEFERAACYGVDHLERHGYAVNIIGIYNQGQADADTKNDELGAGNTPTTSAQYKLILQKHRDAFWRVARMATGRPISPTLWIAPFQSGGGDAGTPLYAAVNIRAIQEGQRLAVRDHVGLAFLPPWSQFANSFQADLVHPYGEAQRLWGEAAGLYIGSGLSPPQMTAATIVNGTTLDVTFDQAVEISATLVEATGYSNDAKGFQAMTSGAAYVDVTAAAAHPSDDHKIRLTVATATLAGGQILNGQQWFAGGVATTYFPRTHVIGTTDIGVSLVGNVTFENFSLPMAKVIA